MKKNAKMEAGSSSQFPDKPKRVKGASISSKLGSIFPKIEPFVPRIDHNPNELRSWAKRTGFVSDYSGFEIRLFLFLNFVDFLFSFVVFLIGNVILLRHLVAEKFFLLRRLVGEKMLQNEGNHY